MKSFVIGYLVLFVGAACADDPCKALSLGGSFSTDTGGRPACIEIINGTPVPRPLDERQVLARIVNNQVVQQAEIAGLRADLKTAINNLSAAVAALEKISTAMAANNRKWQKDTLDTAISSIDAIPAKLAREKTLQDALIAAIKTRLLEDPSFLDAVRKAE